ncbi:hypothetical protein N9N03_02640 [Chlamydiia bacterium]|nr:hypothetical protein [Chlamydiia bacterium]
MSRLLFIFTLTTLLLTGCTNSNSIKVERLIIKEHNGSIQTITHPEKLKSFANTDFLAPQPYKSVTRYYKTPKSSVLSGVITSYHPNGLIAQSLEIKNNQANGVYREWYDSGTTKVQTTIMGGVGSLDDDSQNTWIYNGLAFAWYPDGALQATINYVNGNREGITHTYHPNGLVDTIHMYTNDALHGQQQGFDDQGVLRWTHTFNNGLQHGAAIRYKDTSIILDEHYNNGLLETGRYISLTENNIQTGVNNYSGHQIVYNENTDEYIISEIKNGVVDGIVSYYDDSGLNRTETIQNGMKNGVETWLYANGIPKLQIQWINDVISGVVTTYFDNSTVESIRHINNNLLHGSYLAYYPDGQLMVDEIYENNKLVTGNYYPLGTMIRSSYVTNGQGTATIYNKDGGVKELITYKNGIPKTD